MDNVLSSYELAGLLGKKIRQIRKRYGLTLTELAERTGYSKSYVSHIETHTVDNPSFKAMGRLAEALDMSLVELILLTIKGEEKEEIKYGDLDKLTKAQEQEKRRYRRAFHALNRIFLDETVPAKKRVQFAEEVVSLANLFFFES